jgi:hypothetical protein
LDEGTAAVIDRAKRLRMINHDCGAGGRLRAENGQNGLFRLDWTGLGCAWWNHERPPRHLQHLRDY